MKLTRAFAPVTIAAAVLLSGCGLGFNAGTQTQGNSHFGATADSAALLVRDAVLIVDPAKPGVASVVATLIAHQADNTLTNVSSDGLETTLAVAGTATTNPVELPVDTAVRLGFNSDVAITLAGTITTGTYVNVTFTLASGDPVTVALLVHPNDGIYTDVKVSVPAANATEPTPAPSAS